MLSSAGETEQTQLTDLHSRVQQDRQSRHIRQLQSHVTAEAWVDESGGGVSEQTKAAKAALAFKPAGDVIGQSDDLVCARKNEFAGVQHKLVASIHIDEPGEVGLFRRRINVGVLVVLEHAEELVQAHVDTGRLDHRWVVRLESDASGVDFGFDIAVAEKHAATLPSHGR